MDSERKGIGAASSVSRRTTEPEAEDPEEGQTEFRAERRIENEVDRAVDHHEEIEVISGDLQDSLLPPSDQTRSLQIDSAQSLNGLRQLTDDEDDDDDDQHDRYALLVPLLTLLLVVGVEGGGVGGRGGGGQVGQRHPSAIPCGVHDGSNEERIESEEKEEREEGEEDLICVEVTYLIGGRLTELRCLRHQSRVVPLIGHLLDTELEEFREGDKECPEANDDDDALGAAGGAPDLTLHRVTDADVPFDREGQRQPHRRVAANVGERSTERIAVASVPRLPSDDVVMLDCHGKGKGQVEGVEDSQGAQVAIGRRLHRSSRQHRDAHEITRHSKGHDDGTEYALDGEPRSLEDKVKDFCR